MGSNCNIYLRNDVRIADVLDVIGILLGQQKTKVDLSKFDSFYCRVDDVEIYYPLNFQDSSREQEKNICLAYTGTPGVITINIKNNPIDKDPHFGNFHYETSSGMRMISCGSNEFWMKVGVELVKFFGGYVDYDDCDNIRKDFESGGMRIDNSPEDGEDFNKFNQDMLDLMPIEL